MSPRQLWGWVIGYAALIYSSAYFVQFLMTGLRTRGYLRLSLGVGFCLLASLLGLYLRRAEPTPLEWLLFFSGCLVYGGLAVSMEVLQEGLHLVQYGLMAGLVLAAYEAGRRVGLLRGYLVSSGLTALVGFVDEVLQGVLPNRQWDLRDVRLNALSGMLFLFFVFLRRELRRRGHMSRAVDRGELVANHEDCDPQNGDGGVDPRSAIE